MEKELVELIKKVISIKIDILDFNTIYVYGTGITVITNKGNQHILYSDLDKETQLEIYKYVINKHNDHIGI